MISADGRRMIAGCKSPYWATKCIPRTHRVVVFYLCLGMITCGRLIGHAIRDQESLTFILAGNALLFVLFAIGLFQIRRLGKFLGLEKWTWVVGTVGCYVLGAIINLCLS